MKGSNRDAGRAATKRERWFSVVSDDTARGNGHKLQAEGFRLGIRKKIHQEGDAVQEHVVYQGCVLSISGVFRAQAGKATADLNWCWH